MSRLFRTIILNLIILFIVPVLTLAATNQTIMNSSIKLAPNVFIFSSTPKSSYCPPELINITTRVENKGNLGVMGNLHVDVRDPYGVEFKNGSWSHINLNPGDVKLFFLNHTTSEGDIAGIYTVYSNFSYDGEEKRDETTFRIKQGFGSLVASPSQIEETVFPGDTITKYIYFWLMYACHGTFVDLNTTEGHPGDWVVFTSNPIWLSPETWNVTKILIYIDLPWNTIPGDYEGYIYASIGGEVQLYIPLVIHVQTQGIFDITTDVLSEYKEVCQGGEVVAKTSVLKVFPPGTFDITLTYRIELNNTVYDESSESVAITDELERYPTLIVPSSAPTGVYTFYSILNASGANWTTSAISYDIFRVKECAPPSPPSPPAGVGRPYRKIKEKVSVGPQMVVVNVSKYRLISTLGNTTSFLVRVRNQGDSRIEGLRLTIKGIPKEWVSVYPYIMTLEPNETGEFLVLLKVPKDAEENIYRLELELADGIVSKKEFLIFIVGKDEESTTRMLLDELEKLKALANRTLDLKCLNIGELYFLLEEVERVKLLAQNEIRLKNYKKAQSLLIQALSMYDNIIIKADALMKLRTYRLRPFAIFPFAERIEESMAALEKSMKEREYDQYCENLNRVIKYSFFSMILIVSLLATVVTIVLLIVFIRRKMKEREVVERIKKIRERLRDVLEWK